jgi:hypothetical protein
MVWTAAERARRYREKMKNNAELQNQVRQRNLERKRESRERQKADPINFWNEKIRKKEYYYYKGGAELQKFKNMLRKTSGIAPTPMSDAQKARKMEKARMWREAHRDAITRYMREYREEHNQKKYSTSRIHRESFVKETVMRERGPPACPGSPESRDGELVWIHRERIYV